MLTIAPNKATSWFSSTITITITTATAINTSQYPNSDCREQWGISDDERAQLPLNAARGEEA
jgi:hypothetical protein